jgi:serine/threonine-protein kinase SRPK3
VKVCTGTDSPHFSRETSILQDIQKHRACNEQGAERIIELYDAFIIRGPNGYHECLATEVIIPLTKATIPPPGASQIAVQILEGFAFLHRHNVAHEGKIGLACPTDVEN